MLSPQNFFNTQQLGKKEKKTNKHYLKNTNWEEQESLQTQARALKQREESYQCFAAKVQMDIKDSEWVAAAGENQKTWKEEEEEEEERKAQKQQTE